MEYVIELLSSVAISRHFQKNAILLCQGETPQRVYLVQSGCVKVYRAGPHGDEQIAGFKTAGDIFPECWVFGHSSNTMYYYQAIEDSDVLTLSREQFLDILKDHPELTERYLKYMVKSYTGLMIHMSALGQSYAVDKILMMLYYVMVRHSTEKEPDEFHPLMKLRHTTLASMTGLTRETVTTEMGRLKRQGIVNYDTNSLVIYRKALRDRLGEEAFLEIQFG